MERIDGPNYEPNKFGVLKNGFTEGDPLANPPEFPTQLTSDWFDCTQEELANAVEGEGLICTKGLYTQLRRAIRLVGWRVAVSHWYEAGTIPASSIRGFHWAEVPDVDGPHNVSQWVAAGAGGGGASLHVWDDDNLVDATPVSVTAPMRAVTHGLSGANKRWIAVGDSGALYSTSGERAAAGNWTSRVSGATLDLRAVHATTSTAIAVGNAGRVCRSTDGATWTGANLPAGSPFYGVTHGNGTWVAVGKNGAAGVSCYSVDDGVTWQWQNHPGALNAIIHDGEYFVAVGDSGVVQYATNPAGVWHYNTIPEIENLVGIAFDGTAYVIVSDEGSICCSQGPMVNDGFRKKMRRYRSPRYGEVDLHTCIAAGAGRYAIGRDDADYVLSLGYR